MNVDNVLNATWKTSSPTGRGQARQVEAVKNMENSFF